MKRLLCLVLCLFLLAGCSANVSTPVSPSAEPTSKERNLSYPVSPGAVFEPGGYILFENLNISYDGGVFAITNNREDIVRISVMVIGVKSDGSYELLQYPAFNGADETQYQKDLEENGWAVKKHTNMVRPGETLYAELSIFDFGESYPSPDIDGDGYYDIVFSVHPQESEDTVTASSADPVSELYKLAAK